MFITDLLCISPQNTYALKGSAFPLLKHIGNKYQAVEPSYRSLIPPSVLRRMGKFTRMGVGTGLPLLEKHKNISGIIIGTANGGVNDSMRFLRQIEEYKEGTLTPTNFVQSTPNSLPGTLSMMSGNEGYNNTHVHEGLAFENALLDAMMYIENNKAAILLGAAEEISDWNYNINMRKGYYKTTESDSAYLLLSGTKGSVCGEGAAMFTVEPHKENALAEIADVATIVTTQQSEFKIFLEKFLDKNKCSYTDIYAVLLGVNGDVIIDKEYHDIANNFFNKSTLLSYKNLCGEYATATSFAMWLSVHLLNGYRPPQEIIIKSRVNEGQHILIFNRYHPNMYSLILLKKQYRKS